jgi:hypothetical protein
MNLFAEGGTMNTLGFRPILAGLPFVLVVVGVLSHLYAPAASSITTIVAPLNSSATIAATPGRADAENTFIVSDVQGAAVRLLSRSLDMNMGTTPYAARRLGEGLWQVVNAEVPMVGRWGITVQARLNGTWVTVGSVSYAVPFTGTMRLVADVGHAASPMHRHE